MQPKYYDSINNLPIQVWFDIHKNSDYSKLVINSVKMNDALLIKLSNVWFKIYDQFMEEFGLSDEYMANLRTKVQLAKYQAELILTGQRHFRTLIKIEKEKIRLDKAAPVDPIKLDAACAKMSKFYGFHLNSNKLTVSQYYSYIENISNGR